MDTALDGLMTKQQISDSMDIMNGFGLRLTGTKGQREYCAWLKNQIKAFGLPVFDKQYNFDRWEAHKAALSIEGNDVGVSSAFPYSGLTGQNGVTGRLVVVGNNPISFNRARGKIAVCHIKILSKIGSKVAFDKRNPCRKFRNRTSYRGPVSTTFVKTLLTFWSAKLSGMKGMVCIWEDMSDDMVKGQWLNFILGYLGVPILWVNQTEGAKVLAAAKQKKSATLTLTGFIEKDARTESFYTVIKGTDDTKEAVIINTHTDGCNFCEENGAIGMLSMLRYFINHPAKRNLIFVFVTGHFRLPKFRTGFDQATSRWLADNKNVWKGEYKTVAGCAVEHLGCTEWKDKDG